MSIDDIPTFAFSLSANIYQKCKKAESLNQSDSIKNVLKEWHAACPRDVENNGYSIICKKLKELGLNDIANSLSDPSKKRVGLTIANTYQGNNEGIDETPFCKNAAEKIKESMENWGV